MEGTIISIGIVALVVIVVVYLFCDTGFFKGMKKIPQKMKNHEKKIIKIAEEVVVLWRLNRGEEYREARMTESKLSIGSDEKNDLVIDEATVEPCHAIIYKRYKENEIFFEVVNYAKVNPLTYFNQETRRYERLKRREGKELVGSDIFYLGEVKFKIIIPEDSYTIPT